MKNKTAPHTEDLAFLDSVVENIPDMIFVKEATDLRFVRFNKAGENLLGVPRQDLIGKNDYDFFPKAEADAFTAKDREVLKGGKMVDIAEEPIHTKDRGVRFLHTKKIPILGPDGTPRFLLGISEDITDKRNMEAAQATATEAALELSRTKAELLSSLSHELRTPMNIAMSMIELLLESKLEADQKNYAQTAHRASETLLSILNNVLDYSKGEAGMTKLTSAEFDLRPVLAETLGLFAPRAEAKGLGLRSRVSPDVPTVVRGDRERLRQVLINLVSNAVKFTDKGEVTVSVSKPGYPGAQPGSLEILVRDTGAGISPEDMARLFQPFVQLPNPSRGREKGSGLGLAISRKLAQLMGGDITLESVPGIGSVFRLTVRLPAA